MWIKGITVQLSQFVDSGVTDDFGVPVMSETVVPVENVLVCPASDTEVLETVNLYGKKAIYTLCIPKGDTHDWENTFVTFFGEQWRTIGKPLEYIDDLIPLDWNMKVRVESCE